MAKKETTEKKVAAPAKSEASRIDVLEAQVKELSYIVRKHFTKGKTLPILLLSLLLPIVALNAADVVKYDGDGSTSFAYDTDGDVTVTGGDTVLTAGFVISTPAAPTLVAGGTITVSVATMNLTASALEVPTTTNTIAAPSVAGQWAVLINTGTNSLKLTEGTTLDSGGTKTLGPEDVLQLFAPDTTAWKAIYHDN